MRKRNISVKFPLREIASNCPANRIKPIFCFAVSIFLAGFMLLALTGIANASDSNTLDKFGITKLYRTAANDREWLSKWDNGYARTWSNKVNDPYDPEFWTKGKGSDYSMVTNGNGIMKLTGTTPRMFVIHSYPNLTHYDKWTDVEFTMYGQLTSYPTNAYDGFLIYMRTNHFDLSSTLCDSRGYGGRFRRDGSIDFQKETEHNAGYYIVGSKTKWSSGMPLNTWIGYKFIVYDLPNGSVKLELYSDMTDGLNGGTWVKETEYTDTGSNFPSSGGVACATGINPKLQLNDSNARPGSETGNPNFAIYFKTNNVATNGTWYKKASAREIDVNADSSDMTPPAISAISSSSITSSGTTMSWTTNEASDSQVEYGTTTSYGSSIILNTNLVTSHSQNLSGLTASTLYHYRVKSKDAAGNLATSLDQTFTTQALPGTISGAVKNTSNIAISGSRVTDGTRSATTNTSGNYIISNVPAGTYSVTVIASGYQSSNQSSVGVKAGQTTIVNFNLSPSTDITPPTISAISSSNITSTSSTIYWTTNEASNTQVEYGTTTSYGFSTTLNTNLVTSHSQNLSGLTASTLYHYRIKSKDAAGNLAISLDQTFTASVPASGPVAYWKFDENIGTNAYDSSGNGNNGTISGATWTAGKVGKALSFDGVNDIVDAGNKASLNIINAITIEAWVNPKLISGTSRVIVRKSLAYYFQINSNGKLEVYFYGTTNPGYHRMTSTIPLNTWTHVAVTYNGSKVFLYKNGTSESFNDTGSLVSNTNNVQIGSSSKTSRQFSGLIDEVHIYNRALSASEVLADFKAG